MAGATTCITNRCRKNWLDGNVFTIATDTFKVALYVDSSHDQNTTAYSTTNEVAAGGGYTQSGSALSGLAGPTEDTSNHVAYVDWDDETWSSSTITASDCLIYDVTASNTSWYVGDFSGSKSSSNGAFTITMPAAAYNTSIVRIA